MVNPFVMKIYRMMESSATEYPAAIRWGSWRGHDTIVIKDQALLAKQVLPMFFKHGNLASFVRQLNMYSFRKTSNAVEMEFFHEFFQEGKEHLLNKLKRKAKAPAKPARTVSLEDRLAFLERDQALLRAENECLKEMLAGYTKKTDSMVQHLPVCLQVLIHIAMVLCSLTQYKWEWAERFCMRGGLTADFNVAEQMKSVFAMLEALSATATSYDAQQQVGANDIATHKPLNLQPLSPQPPSPQPPSPQPPSPTHATPDEEFADEAGESQADSEDTSESRSSPETHADDEGMMKIEMTQELTETAEKSSAAHPPKRIVENESMLGFDADDDDGDADDDDAYFGNGFGTLGAALDFEQMPVDLGVNAFLGL